MNDTVLALGLAGWKPLVAALLLPPVPFLLLVLVGARLMFKRQLLAWLLLLVAVLGLWLCSTTAVSRALTLGALQAPPALTAAEVADIKRNPGKTAIVVLGGGRRTLAPEYGVSTLNARSVERLRYGIWLSRETGVPVLFAGGVGRGEQQGQTEGDIAKNMAEREFRHPLRWVENQSRDTHENARLSVALLRPQGIERVILVTHAYHLPRALRNFEEAGAAGTNAAPLRTVGAAVGRPVPGPWKLNDWLPSLRGMEETWLALHELLGLLSGA
jgi:uncharacterized SAM-binding protein YcdF (DUF218 family)